MLSKCAVITGASSGIGLALAQVLAERGHDLVLVARDVQKLSAIAQELSTKHGIKPTPIQMDLSKPGAAAALFAQIEDMPVGIFINNAGAGQCGPFLNTDSEKDAGIISLNITALTELCKLAAAHMQARGGGSILNVASTGAYQPGPYIAVYYASKAYVLSFTQALRKELAGSGVAVSALCPGATATDFSRRAGKRDIRGAMSARAVALRAYKGLQKNKGVIIPGAGNKLAVLFSRLVPGALSARIVGRIQKKIFEEFK